MRLALAILFMAVQAKAATLYVSTTGTHDTNVPPFGDWTRAATNIQQAITLANNGDAVVVGPGDYYTGMEISLRGKTNLTLTSVNGTLFDAEKTKIFGGTNCCLLVSGSNNTISGFSFIGGTATTDGGASGIRISGPCTVSSVIVRGGNYKSGIVNTSAIRNYGTLFMRNSIIVGNTVPVTDYSSALYSHVTTSYVHGCIIEGNSVRQMITSGPAYIYAANSIYGNSFGLASSNGCIARNVTNSLGSVAGYRGSDGIGTSMVWAGVSAYIPRIGSLAQNAGVGYAGIDAAKSGDGGPTLWPIGAEFMGRDYSTNANHGTPVGGVTASTNSPFAGMGGSAAFDGASGTSVNVGNLPAYNFTNNFSVEGWVFRSRTNRAFVADKSDAGWAGWNLMANHSQKIGFQVYGAILDGTNSMSTGVWHHVAASMSNGTVRMFLDGSIDAIHTGKSILSSAVNQPLLLGNRKWTNLGMLGSLAEVRIWNVARTPEEIAANYTNRLVGNEAGLVGYWRLDEQETPITTGPFNLRNPTLQPTFMEAF